MKRTALALMLLPLFSAGAFAAGYTGPGKVEPITTAAAALQAADDANVTLEGHITKQLGNERFEFKDSTGTIQVEIDHEDWPTAQVSETTKVRLTGEVDKDRDGVEIDVDRVDVIQ